MPWFHAHLIWLTLAITPAGAQEADVLTEHERAVHLLSRLTYGPRPGDLEQVLELGADAWLEEQFGTGRDRGVEKDLAEFETLGMTTKQLRASYSAFPDGTAPLEVRLRAKELRELPRDELLEATALRAVFGDAQLAEVVTDFWRNHFNVSYTKTGPAYQMITEWDARVLRQHSLGRFEDLLLATATSPAMLHYLDNAISKRPPTDQQLAEIEREVRRETGSKEAGEAAADRARLRGVNENYARELLELHTFGVDNGYKQEDVVALAEILTGWSYDNGEDGEWTFEFRDYAHVAGSKRFLRQRIQGDARDGQQEGLEALRMLAEHKNTAEFLARKLCQRLISDAPPESAVTKVAATLRREDGDITEALRAIVALDEFWERSAYRSKIKTPQEFVYSALRATGAEVSDWGEVLSRLESMNQPIYHCDDPTGWSDLAEAWLDPGILAQRWRFAMDLAGGDLRGVHVPAELFVEVTRGIPMQEWSGRLVERVLPGGVGVRTGFALDDLVAKNRKDPPKFLFERMLALVLGSPEFQRQ